ncbi:MAG: hypothetical protein P0Y64_12660 [Candidatus Sphingomonas colombiensis]|nr:hypothetical protein [Sphingomonas sp.]WEK42243.1 MAG: hypothetical protein P0Y64_12660 [Sphingomonas sp.]
MVNDPLPEMDAAERAVAVLVQHQRGIVDDIALDARGVADQRAARDRRAAGVAVRTGQYERAVAGLRQAAIAADHAGERIAPLPAVSIVPLLVVIAMSFPTLTGASTTRVPPSKTGRTDPSISSLACWCR